MSQQSQKLAQDRRGLRYGMWDLSGAMGSEAARLGCAQENRCLGGGGCGVKMKRLRGSHWDAGSDLDSGRMLLIQGSGQRLMLGCWWMEPEPELVVSKWGPWSWDNMMGTEQLVMPRPVE